MVIAVVHSATARQGANIGSAPNEPCGTTDIRSGLTNIGDNRGPRSDDDVIRDVNAIDDGGAGADHDVAANSAAAGDRRIHRDVSEIADPAFVIDDRGRVDDGAAADRHERPEMSMMGDERADPDFGANADIGAGGHERGQRQVMLQSMLDLPLAFGAISRARDDLPAVEKRTREFERNRKSCEAFVPARMAIDEKQSRDSEIDRDVTDRASMTSESEDREPGRSHVATQEFDRMELCKKFCRLVPEPQEILAPGPGPR